MAQKGKGRTLSVRTLLVSLVLGCLLPGALGTGILFFLEYQRREAQLRDNTVLTTRALVQAVDSQLQRADAIAQTLATSTHLARRDLAAFHHQADDTLKRTGIGAHIALFDRTGQMLINTRRPGGSPLPFSGNPRQIQQVVATGKGLVSDLYVGSVWRQPIVSVFAPVLEEGKVTYVIAVGLQPENLSPILQAERMNPDWVATILDKEGTVVARHRDNERFVGRKPSPVLRQRLAEVAEGTVEADTLEGVPALYAFSRSSVTGWSVNLGVPRQGIRAELLHALLPLALGLAALFGVGIALALGIGRRISGACTSLTASALALGDGLVVAAPTPNVQEAASVASALAQAGQLLQEHTEALRASEERLTLALRADRSGTFDWDAKSGRIRWSDEMLSLYGLRREDFRDSCDDWMNNIVPEDREAVRAAFERSLQAGKFSIDFRIRRRDTGEIRWISGQADVYFDREGKPLRMVGVNSDINDRKHIEEALRQEQARSHCLNAELEERVRERTAELEHSNEALLHANTELQHFAHATAHDLKTPLRSIVSFAQLLQETVKDYGHSQADAWAAQVVDNTRRLHTMIENLLAYTRLETQGLPFEPVDLGRLFDEVTGSLATLIKESGAEVDHGELPVVQADRTQIAQVLQNLIENGIKYNHSHPPRVMVTAELQEDEWIISVADNGIGIDPRHHERIFEIFKRLHVYTDIPGSGIGLALCRRIIERHRGHIWVESTFGKGSTFYFSLKEGAP